MSTRDLEEQLDNEEAPSTEVETDEPELEFDDLGDEEPDPEDLDDDEGNLLGAVEEDDDSDEDETDDEDLADEEEDAVASAPRGDGSQPASLDEILARKPDPRRSTTEDEDIMSVVSGGDEIVSERLPSRIAPVRERQEFVCKSCFLVKSRSQLADKARELCRDCV